MCATGAKPCANAPKAAGGCGADGIGGLSTLGRERTFAACRTAQASGGRCPCRPRPATGTCPGAAHTHSLTYTHAWLLCTRGTRVESFSSWGLGFRFRAYVGIRFRVQGVSCRLYGVGLQVRFSRRVQGLGCRVELMSSTHLLAGVHHGAVERRSRADAAEDAADLRRDDAARQPACTRRRSEK